MLTLDELLNLTLEQGASDLHLKVGTPPLLRINGELETIDRDPLTAEETKALSYSVLTPNQISHFEKDFELDFAYAMPGLARFRGNVFYQRGVVQSIFRVIPLQIKTMEELNLPAVCRFFAERPHGLVLVTGPAGSGKSTTLAAMIDYINTTSAVHIITLEDPLEFLHQDKQAVINQRELGRDTRSFRNALRAALRQDPDVIMVGEMRDLETISLAVTAAETGHLVFGTLHTTDAIQTIDRVIDVFPEHQQQQIRMQLSVNLVGIVSQTLVRTIDKKGRMAAFETLVGIPSVCSMIREAKTHQISSMIQTGGKQGMRTLDQALSSLVRKGLVTFEDALTRAADPAELKALCGPSENSQDILDIDRSSNGAPRPQPGTLTDTKSPTKRLFGFGH